MRSATGETCCAIAFAYDTKAEFCGADGFSVRPLFRLWINGKAGDDPSLAGHPKTLGEASTKVKSHLVLLWFNHELPMGHIQRVLPHG